MHPRHGGHPAMYSHVVERLGARVSATRSCDRPRARNLVLEVRDHAVDRGERRLLHRAVHPRLDVPAPAEERSQDGIGFAAVEQGPTGPYPDKCFAETRPAVKQSGQLRKG